MSFSKAIIHKLCKDREISNLVEMDTRDRKNRQFPKSFLQDNWEMWGKCGENLI